MDLSVIIPAYRSEQTLKTALLSILEGQETKRQYEVLLLLSPSEDGSLALAKEMGQAHKNLRVIELEEVTPANVARMKGVELAKAELVSFMDADDEARPNYVEDFCVAFEKEKDADIVVGGFAICSKKKHTRPYILSVSRNVPGEKALRIYFHDLSIRGFMWNKAYRKSLFDKRPLIYLSDPEDLFEDEALNLSLFYFARRVITFRKPVYVYHKDNEKSLTSAKRFERAKKELLFFAAGREFLSKMGEERLLRHYLASLKFRRFWLSYDLSFDKKNGKGKDYVNQVKREYRSICDPKKPLDKENASYSAALSRALLDK